MSKEIDERELERAKLIMAEKSLRKTGQVRPHLRRKGLSQ